MRKHTRPQPVVLKHVKRTELLRIHALQAQDLDARARKPALRRFRRAFHKQHHGRRRDGRGDGGARFRREVPAQDRAAGGACAGGLEIRAGDWSFGGAEGLVNG